MRSTTSTHGIEINSVLRNTYMLLSMTLVFSAITAFIGVNTVISPAMYLGTVIGGFVLLFATLALRNSSWGLLSIFAFTGLEGFGLGPLLQHYIKLPGGGMLVATAAGMTAVVFLALSLYVLVSRKDFSFLGGMLFVALIVLVVASLVGVFFHVPGMHLVLSVIGVLVFSGYILYDTSRIVHGGETNYIVATVGLYLDILNLFISILNILGFLSGSSRDD